MTEVTINADGDLEAINNQIGILSDELGKINQAKDNIIGQIAQLQGVASYLRGKLSTEEIEELEVDSDDPDLERSIETPKE